MKRKIIILSVIMISIFLTSFVSMGSQASNVIVPHQDPVITLGGLFPLTGGLAGGGVERDAAARMAIEEINADTTFDFEINFLVRNTETDPAVGPQVAQEVIDLGAVGLVGAGSSSVSKAIASGPALTNKVPQISYSSTNPDLSDKTTYPYFLRVVPSDAEQGVAIANIVDEFGWDNVTTLATSDDYGLGGIGVFEAAAEDLGMTIASPQRFAQGAADVKPQLQAIADSGVKIIVLNAIVGDALTVFSQAGDVGVTAEDGFVWFGTDGPTQAAVFEESEAAKEAMQGMVGTRPVVGVGNAFQDFLTIWEDCFGSDDTEYAGCGDRTPNTYATFAYDAVYTFANAFQHMIDEGQDYTDGDALLAVLKETDFTGATGQVTFNDKLDRVPQYDFVNLQGDEFKTVGGYDPVNGFSLTETIYWDGDASGNDTETPTDIATAPGFGIYLAIISLFVVLPLLRRRRK